MASWQAHLVDLLARLLIKRKLKGTTSLEVVRATLSGGKFPDPKGVDFTAASVGGIPGEWVTTPGLPTTAPVLLYLHGGGYFACSPRTHRPITSFYAKAGLRVFVPDYRLAPENPFPAALDDATASYRGLLAGGATPAHIVVSGDSAGGGLSAALLLNLRALDLPLPAAAALFCPWTDLAGTGPSVTENAAWDAMFWAPGLATGAAFYHAGQDPKNPLISPLYGDPTGLPPLLIHVGKREILRDDSTRFATRAQAAGVRVELKIWPVVPHVWQLLHRFIPEGRQSLQAASEFLKSAAGAG
jgi:acetyl esterase/lipase